MAIKHAFASGKSDGGDATLVRPSNWNADHVIDSQIGLPLVVTPTMPAADTVALFGRKVAGRMLPAYIGPSGLDSVVQSYLARNKIGWIQPNGNATTISSVGLVATATGTATTANVATTNQHTWMRRLDYLVTTAATTAVAGFRSSAAQFGRGNAAGVGGFTMVCRFGPATGVATSTNRCFVGMMNSTAAPTDVNPSTLVNMFGFGWDAADTNIQFFNNDASGTATKTDLGATFPRPTSDRANVYEVALFCAPNGSTIGYQFTNLSTGDTVSGSVTTDIPGTTTLLAPKGYMSVGGTSSVIGIALMSLYVESDS